MDTVDRTRRRGVTRRALLTGAGAVTVLVAGGAVWRAWDQGVWSAGPGPAYEPWRSWRGDPGEGALALVRAAILAANPHNSQPWRFRVESSRIDILADPARHLGAIDPLRREMFIGLGCALENLLLAAAAQGYAHRLTLMPDPADAAHAARIDLTRTGGASSDLYEAIPTRHTNRGAYDGSRGVSRETLRALERLAGEDARLIWFTSEADRRRAGDLIVRATEAIIADREQSEVTPRWMRFRWADVERFRDGLTVDATVHPRLMRVAAKMLPPVSRERADQFWLQATRDTVVPTAAGFGILAVRDASDPSQRLRGGRIWQRMHLWAATQGLSLHPLSQITERADRESSLGVTPEFGSALGGLVGDPRWRGLMAFRFGYAVEPAALSPRRAVEDVLA